MPPEGGFGSRSVPYRRHLPSRGPPGWVWLSGVSALILTGFYLHSRSIRIRTYPPHYIVLYATVVLFREIEREKRQARLALTPLLLAENDRAQVVRRMMSQLAEARANLPDEMRQIYKTDTPATRARIMNMSH